jgi:large subunit ribosomal protein L33
MHATRFLAMAKGKTIAIKLVSSAGTGFFYTTRKNVSSSVGKDKMAFIKFDPIVRQRVLFNETKINRGRK